MGRMRALVCLLKVATETAAAKSWLSAMGKLCALVCLQKAETETAMATATNDDDDKRTRSVPAGNVSRINVGGSVGGEGTTNYRVINSGGRYPGTFSGSHTEYPFDDWGYWPTEGNETLYKAFIRGDMENGESYTLHIEGTPPDINPVSGSAVWSGGVRAYDTHPDTLGTPVGSGARIEVEFCAVTLDVELTNFTQGHDDMSWQDPSIVGGTFQHRSGLDTLDGAFYGDEHQGAAGAFERDRLRDIFGTLRQPEPKQ